MCWQYALQRTDDVRCTEALLSGLLQVNVLDDFYGHLLKSSDVVYTMFPQSSCSKYKYILLFLLAIVYVVFLLVHGLNSIRVLRATQFANKVSPPSRPIIDQVTEILISDQLPSEHVGKGNIRLFNDTTNINCQCVPLRVPNSVVNSPKICIYNTSDDIYVSGSLKKYGSWESGTLSAFGRILHEHPNLFFLDVGSHVGTFTLYANALGHQVIAIDPLLTNLQLLNKSLHLVNQQSKVVLLWNAVSNVYENVKLGFRKENIGSTHILSSNSTLAPSVISAAEYSVPTILLDDLVNTFGIHRKDIFMKMDIEGSEMRALMGATKFFDENNVCYVNMELVFHKKSGQLHTIVQFLKRYDLDLYAEADLKTIITNNYNRVGDDGFFANKKCGKSLK